MSSTKLLQEDGTDVIAEQPGLDQYDAVKYNALKHGILSKNVVLPHEDQEEFDNLLSALRAEHRPSGGTAECLVEELAGIMWRKRRVLLAEGARRNRGVRQSLLGLESRSSDTLKNAVPGDPVLADSYVDYRDLLTMAAVEVEERKQEAMRDQEATVKADQILQKNSKTAYNRALKTLLPESRDWWLEQLESGEIEATSADLRSLYP